MRVRAFEVTLMVLVLAVGLTAPSYGQAQDTPDRPIDIAEEVVLDPVDPTPGPGPLPTMIFTAEEPQLVGFTTALFNGNNGVLNLSIACGKEFPRSRMCTLQEVNRTTVIPRGVRMGHAAWVMDERATLTMDTNCQGWMSGSGKDFGTAIDLGICYGGQYFLSCDQQLAVACCARSGTMVAH